MTSKKAKGKDFPPSEGEDMDKRNRIEREVEATLRLLEEEVPAEASPGFLAGVHKRIRALAPEPKRPAPAVLRRRLLIPALLVLMIVVNVVTVVFAHRTRRSEVLASRQGYTALADDYAAHQTIASAYLK